DLASLFKTRIELRQIGVRDEAARLTGVGRCGREYCCSTWLKELTPVSLALAKDQNLSLNPSQISGGCGRLLCCLKYEHEFYAAQRRRFPKEGKMIRTAKGGEKVVAVDIFRERVFLRGEDGSRIIPLIELQEEQAQVALLPPDASASASPSAPQAQSPPRQESRREQPRRSDSTSRPNRPENRRPINPAEPPRAETPPAAAVVPPIEPVAPPAAAGDSFAAAKPDGTKGRRNRRRRRGRRPPDSAPGAPPENPGN
ncbi:MAG: regulatory iron-sulfur-containing complex subunit RicT, partial [Gemmatimonadota bacterium]